MRPERNSDGREENDGRGRRNCALKDEGFNR